MKHNTRTRDDHLFAPGRKRILALDGGGVLGVIEIAFIEQIEKLLRRRTGDPDLVLSDYFDLIGGTSTGAIVATALALGMDAKSVKKLYFDFGPAIFKRPLLSVPGYSAKFDARTLSNKLRGILMERQLSSDDLKTGLALILKRLDTASPWVLTNNSNAQYWNDPDIDPETGKRPYIGNKHYHLWKLVRGSTAAPFFFNPKEMLIAEEEDPGLFIDGGVSPHNNPSLQLLMLAGIEGYGFNWPISKNDLMMISIGCGWMRPRIKTAKGRRAASGGLAVHALRGLVWDSQVNTLKIMQWLSEPRKPWWINSEVGTLEQDFISGATGSNVLLNFQRYDIAFESQWLKKELDIVMTDAEAAILNDFTEPDVMTPVYNIASEAALRHVHDNDFPSEFDI